MMCRIPLRIGLILIVAVLSGCYGGKMVKMPIHAEATAQRLDTLQMRQDELIRQLAEFSEELEMAREERIQGSAANEAKLTEIEEAILILSNKVDDALQLMQTRSSSQSIPVKPVRREMPDTSRATERDTMRAPADASSAEEAEKLYQDSYMDLTLGNFKLAMQGFKNYLVRHPQGARMSEVHYYLGECYYSTDKFLEAVGEYQYVIREYPQSRLIPAAHLKAGLCYTRLEEYNLAEKSFRELISKYPHTEEAERARLALQDLGG